MILYKNYKHTRSSDGIMHSVACLFVFVCTFSLVSSRTFVCERISMCMSKTGRGNRRKINEEV